MPVPLVATADAAILEAFVKEFEVEEMDWATEGIEGFDTEGIEGFDTEGIEGFATEGIEGFDTEGIEGFATEGMDIDDAGMEGFDTEEIEGFDVSGMEGFDTEGMEGFDACDERDEAAKMGVVEGFVDWSRRVRFRSRNETKSVKTEFRFFHRELYSCDQVLV